MYLHNINQHSNFMLLEYNSLQEHLTQKYSELLLSVCFTQHSLFHILQSSQPTFETMGCTSTCVLEYNARFTISNFAVLGHSLPKYKNTNADKITSPTYLPYLVSLMTYRTDICYCIVSLVSGCSQKGSRLLGSSHCTKSKLKKKQIFVYTVISTFNAVYPSAKLGHCNSVVTRTFEF